MTGKAKILSAWLILSLSVLACTVSFGGGGLSDEEKLQTAVAQTVAANQQVQPSPQQVDQSQATDTTAPADNAPSSPTATPEPCNRAEFVSETVPDNTQFDTGEGFTKSWRIRNTGTCTWNTSYQLVFAEGDKMSGPSSVNLTQSVDPGEQIDISVNLTAPNSAGTYKGYWKVRDDEGNYFVNNLWVQIKAVAPGPPPKPDLVVANFDITPSTPTQGDNTHVKVRVKNIGGADAGAFTVQWYGLDSFASPSCTWNVASLAADQSKWVECDFVFASWYPVNKTTVVYLDTGNTVDESDEGNNSKTKSPFGVNP